MVHTSDSLGSSHDEDGPVYKKRKIAPELPKLTSSATANAHLRGRKRFNADLANMKEECKGSFEVDGLRLGYLKAGDDEGVFEFNVLNSSSEHALAVTLIVSDTSKYPDRHNYLAFSSDADVPSHILEVMESMASGQPQDIRGVLAKLLALLSSALSTGSHVPFQEINEDDGSDGDDYDAYDECDSFDIPSSPAKSLKILVLKRDFLDIVARGYRPGFINFGVDGFALSVALPIITLACHIPPQALMAWDRRLLSRTQHLTLLINNWRGMYPIIQSDGVYLEDFKRLGFSLSFKVGFTRKYKPDRDHAAQAGMSFNWITPAAKDLEEIQVAENQEPHSLSADHKVEEVEPDDEDRFEKFSLSSSLESLLENVFLGVVHFRRKFGLGWAAAETLSAEVERSQKLPEDVFKYYQPEIKAADEEERTLAGSYSLPFDPLDGLGQTANINLPLTAFCYLLRRLTLCTRYCIVCHKKITPAFESLKPYVCDSKLCSYQYYSLNQGPSIEYEICNNPKTVDLLVSLAYTAAIEKVMEEPFPIGMGLRVPIPDPTMTTPVPSPQLGLAWAGLWGIPVMSGIPMATPIINNELHPGVDGLCNFDDMDIWQMRATIAELINSLPPIMEIKKHLDKQMKAGKSKPNLRDMDSNILSAAWSILRWCIASCTAYLEELTDEEDHIRNIDSSWRQFRFSVGAPDAEAKFKTAIVAAQKKDKNARKFPSLYAFHGSPTKNWHSIIRHGLWYKTIAHGRSHGNGVYMAKDASVSMSGYAVGSSTPWKNSSILPSACVAMTEIVNLPREFVCREPFYVVQHTDWIMCRYLLVQSATPAPAEPSPPVLLPMLLSRPMQLAFLPNPPPTKTYNKIPLVALDPAHPLTYSATNIEIPKPSYKMEALLRQRRAEYREEAMDDDDRAVFEAAAEQDLG